MNRKHGWKKRLCIAALCAACAPAVQARDADKGDGSPAGVPAKEREMPQEDLETEKYQEKAEALCTKRLGFSAPKGKVFGQR
ncbi:MAG: hypothetical protein LBE85_09670 [Candidatus Accumulibacter sp.]|jgi:hypothetical protein|nr:hypothetical protein [Accumulibacter sp.]